jgi:hypothetical protein
MNEKSLHSVSITEHFPSISEVFKKLNNIMVKLPNLFPGKTVEFPLYTLHKLVYSYWLKKITAALPTSEGGFDPLCVRIMLQFDTIEKECVCSARWYYATDKEIAQGYIRFKERPEVLHQFKFIVN